MFNVVRWLARWLFTRTLDFNVHFWLGSESSAADATVAALKTYQLSQHLGDLPVQHREVEGYESVRRRHQLAPCCLLRVVVASAPPPPHTHTPLTNTPLAFSPTPPLSLSLSLCLSLCPPVYLSHAQPLVSLTLSLLRGVCCCVVVLRAQSRFASYFKAVGGVQYLQGGVTTGFRHVVRERYDPTLLHIKGRRCPRTKQVPVSIASLNQGDAFILDLGTKLFLVRCWLFVCCW
jgi:hypothetical protein